VRIVTKLSDLEMTLPKGARFYRP